MCCEYCQRGNLTSDAMPRVFLGAGLTGPFAQHGLHRRYSEGKEVFEMSQYLQEYCRHSEPCLSISASPWQSYKELLRRAVLGLLWPLISTVAELWLPRDPRFHVISQNNFQFSPALPGKVLMGKECHGCFSGIHREERIRSSRLMCKLQA